MPIGRVWIYRLLFVFVCFFVCTVTDFSAEKKASGVKFCSAVHRRPRHIFVNFALQKPKIGRIGQQPGSIAYRV